MSKNTRVNVDISTASSALVILPILALALVTFVCVALFALIHPTERSADALAFVLTVIVVIAIGYAQQLAGIEGPCRLPLRWKLFPPGFGWPFAQIIAASPVVLAATRAKDETIEPYLQIFAWTPIIAYGALFVAAVFAEWRRSKRPPPATIPPTPPPTASPP